MLKQLLVAIIFISYKAFKRLVTDNHRPTRVFQEDFKFKLQIRDFITNYCDYKTRKVNMRGSTQREALAT